MLLSSQLQPKLAPQLGQYKFCLSNVPARTASALALNPWAPRCKTRTCAISQRRPQVFDGNGALVLVPRAPANDQHDRLGQPVLQDASELVIPEYASTIQTKSRQLGKHVFHFRGTQAPACSRRKQLQTAPNMQHRLCQLVLLDTGVRCALLPAGLAQHTLSTGLDRKPSMPAARHSSRSRSLALAVIATIGSTSPARRITCMQLS